MNTTHERPTYLASHPDRDNSTQPGSFGFDREVGRVVGHVAVVWCPPALHLRVEVKPGDDWHAMLTSAAEQCYAEESKRLRPWEVDFFVHYGLAGPECGACGELVRDAGSPRLRVGFGETSAAAESRRSGAPVADSAERSPGGRRVWTGARGALLWGVEDVVLAGVLWPEDDWLPPLSEAAAGFARRHLSRVSLDDVEFERR